MQRDHSLAVVSLLLSCYYQNVAAASDAQFMKHTPRVLISTVRGGSSESANAVPDADASSAVADATEAAQKVAASADAEDMVNQPSESDKQPTESDPPQRRKRKRARDAPGSSSAAGAPELQAPRFYRTMVRSATGRVIVAGALLTMECCKVSLHYQSQINANCMHA